MQKEAPHKKKKTKKRKQTIYFSILKAVFCASLLLCCLIFINLGYHVLKNNVPDTSLADKGSRMHSNSAQKEPGSKLSSSGKKTAKNKKEPSSDTKTAKNDKQPSSDANTAQTEEQAPAAVSKDTTLVFAGDIYFSDYVLAAYQQSGTPGVFSEGMLQALTGADLAMANNEFAFSTRGTPAPDKQFTFRVDPSYVSILQNAGIDIVTLANNHVLDFGTDALTDTFQTFDQAGIAYIGAGDSLQRASKPYYTQMNGLTFGFLAASRVFPVISWNVENAQPGVFSAYDPTKLIAAVEKASQNCDFLSVYVHWGIERSLTPEEYQTTMAHALIDAGADVVIGAHPHVLQGVEFYKGKPIFYSLGNFVFYQTIEQTALAKVTIRKDHTLQWQFLPAYAANACTSLLTDPALCQQFYQNMNQLSVNAVFKEDGTVSEVKEPSANKN